jgi:DNA-directed RNA polymerase subunit N (RpoN/RPB10)
MSTALTYRGELRCFSCGRYLGDFESHPEAHGRDDVHLLSPEGGQKVLQPLQTPKGLRCPACQGRVVTSEVDRIAA